MLPALVLHAKFFEGNDTASGAATSATLRFLAIRERQHFPAEDTFPQARMFRALVRGWPGIVYHSVHLAGLGAKQEER